MLKPDLSKIPKELTDRPQWVVWKIETRDDKPTKVPYCAADPTKKAKADEPDTWGTFSQAAETWEAHKGNGIAGVGYEFSFYDPYTGIDLDKCRNPDTGELRYCARMLLEYLNSYSETSVSETGTHTLVKGKWPLNEGNTKATPCGMKWEFFGVGKYFTVTGAHLQGTPTTIEPRQEKLTALHRAIFCRKKREAPTSGPSIPLNLSDAELIERAHLAANGGKFSRLWRGDTTDHAGDDSAADLALCSVLAFWTGPDPERIDRLFKQSGLCRDKWERNDYRERTIGKALSEATEYYSPGRQRPESHNGAGQAAPEPDPTTATEKQNQPGSKQKPALADAALPAGEFVNLDMAPRRKLLHPWLSEASIGMIYSFRGIGKTNLGISITDAVAQGAAFGPWEAGVGVPVFYLDAELPMQDASERLIGLLGEIPPNFIFLSDHYASSLGLPKANLADEKWRKELKGLLVNLQVKLWVADNIASLTPGIDENDKAAWDPVNQFLLELRFAGIASLLLHHSGKTGTQRGTSGREDNLDYVISLSRPKNYKLEDGCRFIARLEKSRVRQNDLFLITDTEFQLVTDENGAYTWTFSNVRQKDKANILLLLNEGHSGKEIAELVGVTKGYVSQVKKKAIGEGYLTEDGKLTPAGLILLNSN
jgi:hypothetical protein